MIRDAAEEEMVQDILAHPVRDFLELASLGAFIAMIALAARAFGA